MLSKQEFTKRYCGFGRNSEYKATQKYNKAIKLLFFGVKRKFEEDENTIIQDSKRKSLSEFENEEAFVMDYLKNSRIDLNELFLDIYIKNFESKEVHFLGTDAMDLIITKDYLEHVRNDEEIDADIIELYTKILLTENTDHDFYVMSAFIYNPFEKQINVTDQIVNSLHNINPNKTNINKILIPINFCGNHWILLEIHADNSTVKIYDSLRRAQIYYAPLRDFVQQIRNSFFDEEHKNVGRIKWDLQDVQQQKDLYNCGIFTLLFLTSRLKNDEVQKTYNEDMHQLRNNILLKIIKSGQLDN